MQDATDSPSPPKRLPDGSVPASSLQSGPAPVAPGRGEPGAERYQVGNVLGEGGMGRVSVAQDAPMYCYHPGLSPVGKCRICQVEVKQGDAPGRGMVACRTQPVEGMIVDTESPKAHQTRRECLEFLLKNHPLDCPICEKAGECTLQKLYFEHDNADSRVDTPKVHKAKAVDLGPTIVLDQERCIQCARCIRFQSDIAGDSVIGFDERGRSTQIISFSDPGFDSVFSGNTSDICPVGALTTNDFRFGARPWELQSQASICTQCPGGCSTSA